MPAVNYALKFTAGKFTGGEFPLRPNREITIGRGSEFDMVLDEDMVSRRHAKISTYHGQIIISDLKSTNGTFVNSERITVAPLQVGDKIMIGTSVMQVIVLDGSSLHHTPQLGSTIQLQMPNPNLSTEVAMQSPNFGVNPRGAMAAQSTNVLPVEGRPSPMQGSGLHPLYDNRKPVKQGSGLLPLNDNRKPAKQGSGLHPLQGSGLHPLTDGRPVFPQFSGLHPLPDGRPMVPQVSGLHPLPDMSDTPSSRCMSGHFPEDGTLTHLIELFSNSHRSGVLVITDQRNREGRIFFKNGEVYYATIAQPSSTGEAAVINPLKCFFRLLQWQEGDFTMDNLNELPSFSDEIEGSTQHWLVEGARQYDELLRMKEYLPEPDRVLSLCIPLEPQLSNLSAEVLDTLQLVLNLRTMGAILDRSKATDFETCTNILYLLQNRYITII